MPNIFIIGFMGSGKTKVGRALSKIIGYNFIDTDQYIAQQEGRSISLLFQEKGQAYFRAKETQFLKALKVENTVIATGGGMPCLEENLFYMKQKGVTIYIHRPLNDLVSYLENATVERPLLKGLSKNAREEKITQLLARSL